MQPSCSANMSRQRSKLLSKYELPKIAVNIAKVPRLLQQN
jgi:hypothetical protein